MGNKFPSPVFKQGKNLEEDILRLEAINMDVAVSLRSRLNRLNRHGYAFDGMALVDQYDAIRADLQHQLRKIVPAPRIYECYAVFPWTASSEYVAVIVATCHLNPLDYSKEWHDDLIEMGFPHGRILFDLLLCNGSKDRRFFHSEMENGVFRKTSVQIKNWESLSQVMAPVLKQNIQSLNLDLLSHALRYAVKEGMPPAQLQE